MEVMSVSPVFFLIVMAPAHSLSEETWSTYLNTAVEVCTVAPARVKSSDTFFPALSMPITVTV